jgi:hypothetical protein
MSRIDKIYTEVNLVKINLTIIQRIWQQNGRTILALLLLNLSKQKHPEVSVIVPLIRLQVNLCPRPHRQAQNQRRKRDLKHLRLSNHQNVVVNFNAMMRSLFPSCFKGKSSEILFRTGQGAIAFKKKRMEKRSLF